MATLYVIPNWDKDFENAKSRVVGRATWFPVQNHFDGKRMRRLQKLRNSVELYGAFHAIVAIASKCPFRGVLLDDHGPINAMDLEDKTGFPAKIFTRAFHELSLPMIGLLEKHEIEEIEGRWELPDSVKTWAVSRGYRRPSKSPKVPASPHGDAQGPEEKQQPLPRDGDAEIPSSAGASPQVPASPRKSPSGDDRPLKGTEQKGTEVPSAVSQGRQPAERSAQSPSSPGAAPIGRADLLNVETGAERLEGNRITSVEVAKRLICEKILGGKDPARPWSNEAMHGLVALLPLPLEEILDIGWFRSLPKSEDVPELKNRRDPVTETGLMNYWGDELQRAREFKKKWRPPGRNGSASKPEPAHWREVLMWVNGPDIRLPGSYWELERDQQAEYEANFQAFGKREEGALL